MKDYSRHLSLGLRLAGKKIYIARDISEIVINIGEIINYKHSFFVIPDVSLRVHDEQKTGYGVEYSIADAYDHSGMIERIPWFEKPHSISSINDLLIKGINPNSKFALAILEKKLETDFLSIIDVKKNLPRGGEKKTSFFGDLLTQFS